MYLEDSMEAYANENVNNYESPSNYGDVDSVEQPYPAPAKRDPMAVTALVMSIITSVLFALPVLFDFYIVLTYDEPARELGVGTVFIGFFLSPIVLIAFILAIVAALRISNPRYKAKFSWITLAVTIISPIVLASAFMLAMWMNT